MEVMVPAHRADKNAADLRGILCGFVPVCSTWATRGRQWLTERRQNKANTDFLEVFVFCYTNVYTTETVVILSRSKTFRSWTPFVCFSIKPCFFDVNCHALPATSPPLIIWRLAANTGFIDVSTIHRSKLPLPPLHFDSIGLSNFPVNAWNVFLHTFLSGHYKRNHENEIESEKFCIRFTLPHQQHLILLLIKLSKQKLVSSIIFFYLKYN